ncbi:Sec-independent protein translocase protein TatB [Chromobacterium phragmitis]|uniref:Sec-independent protein translocase protein TatB n=1 Tax=Chromobacterium phragmitis TaxID=2202141 RepID=A0ABV0IX00_9NEIS
MLDISFGEFVLIGAVALVVLGPERLPTVARTVGALLARAQRFVATMKADMQQQANLQGLDSLRQAPRL